MKHFKGFLVTVVALLTLSGQLLADPQTAAKSVQDAIAGLSPEEARDVLAQALSQLAKDQAIEGEAPTQPASTAATIPAGKRGSIEDHFISLRNAGFRLQQGPGSSKPDINPATFSFEKNIEAGSSTAFGSQFYFGWSPNRKIEINPFTLEEQFTGVDKITPNTAITYEASVQGNLSTQTPDSSDAWRFRLGGELDHTGGDVTSRARMIENFRNATGLLPSQALTYEQRRLFLQDAPFYLGSFTTFAAKYESDLDFETGRVGFEAMWTPTTRIPGNGVYFPIGNLAKFNWRPYVGIDAGAQVGSDGRTDFVDDNLWVIARGTANLSLEFLEALQLFDSVDLFADETFRILTDMDESFSFLTTGVNFGFNDYIGLEFSYRIGKDAPNFEKVETVSGALSIRF